MTIFSFSFGQRSHTQTRRTRRFFQRPPPPPSPRNLPFRHTPRYGQSGDESESQGNASNLKAENACEGCCNGLSSNCDLRVNEVLFAMVHNAMSSRDDLFAAYNNIENLERALVAGYRGLMIDSCICDGSLGEEVANFVKGDGNKVRTMHIMSGISENARIRLPHQVRCICSSYYIHIYIYIYMYILVSSCYRVKTISVFVTGLATPGLEIPRRYALSCIYTSSTPAILPSKYHAASPD